MRRIIIGLMIVIAVPTLAPRTHASNVGFNFGINIGNIPAPVYASPPVVIDEPPELGLEANSTSRKTNRSFGPKNRGKVSFDSQYI